MCEGTLEIQKRVLDVLELGLQAGVSPVQALGTELGSSGVEVIFATETFQNVCELYYII